MAHSTAYKVSGPIGLSRNSIAPSALTISEVAGSTLPLSTMTGIREVLADCFSLLSASIPVPPGICTSSTITSGGDRRALMNACIASWATTVSTPLARSPLESR